MGEPNLNALSTYKYPRRIKFESKPEPKEGKEKSPGPKYAMVEMDKTKYAKSPAISIASAGHIKEKPNAAPGPGAYNVASSCVQLGKGFGFGSASRLPKQRLEKAPGPGEYPDNRKFGGLEVSITCAPKGDVKVTGLGPGQYTPNFKPLENTAPAVSFTSGLHGKARDNKVPGPGQYGLPTTMGGNVTLRRVPSYSFTTGGQPSSKGRASGNFCGQPTTFKIP